MNHILIDYKIDSKGDFSQSKFYCYDTDEDYRYLALEFTLADDIAASLVGDFTILANYFTNSDTYDEWQIVRVIAKHDGTYDIGHTEQQKVEIPGELVEVLDDEGEPVLDEFGEPTFEEGPPTTEMQDVFVVDEVKDIVSLNLTYVKPNMKSASKKERISSKNMGPLEDNIINIWNIVASYIDNDKTERKAAEKTRRDRIDAGEDPKDIPLPVVNTLGKTREKKKNRIDRE